MLGGNNRRKREPRELIRRAPSEQLWGVRCVLISFVCTVIDQIPTSSGLNIQQIQGSDSFRHGWIQA